MKKSMLLLSMVILTAVVYGQNYKGQAELFFSKFKTASSVNKYIFDNLPTLEECRYVFKGNIADTFFARITALNAEVQDTRQQPEEFFEGGLKVFTFLTEDIINERGNVSGGMMSIKDSFLPGVTFYKVSFLKKKADEYGVAYKYFVFINFRWVMFPKPFDVLSDKKN